MDAPALRSSRRFVACPAHEGPLHCEQVEDLTANRRKGNPMCFRSCPESWQPLLLHSEGGLSAARLLSNLIHRLSGSSPPADLAEPVARTRRGMIRSPIFGLLSNSPPTHLSAAAGRSGSKLGQFFHGPFHISPAGQGRAP